MSVRRAVTGAGALLGIGAALALGIVAWDEYSWRWGKARRFTDAQED